MPLYKKGSRVIFCPFYNGFTHGLKFLCKIFTVNQLIAKVLVKIVLTFFGQLGEAGLPLRPVLKSGFSKNSTGWRGKNKIQ